MATVKTWEFGTIRIIEDKEITIYDSYIRDDILCEYSYYQLASGEIVAVDNWADMRISDEEWDSIIRDPDIDDYFEIENLMREEGVI